MKNNPPFSVKISAYIKEIGQKEWEAIFPDIPEGYGYFKTCDEALSGQFKPYYISIYEGRDIICVAPCFIMDYPLYTTIEGPLKNIAAKFPEAVKRFFTIRVFICGSPACEGRIGIKEMPDQEAVIKLLVDTMHSIAKRERASIIAFKDFSREYSKILDKILTMGFRKLLSYPSVNLDIGFKSFKEHMASLSKATRRDLKRKFKRIDSKPKIEMEVKDRLDGLLLDEAYKLYMKTFERSDVQFEKISKEFFKRIAENMPAKARFFLWRLGERLVAVDLCLVSKGILVDEYIGLDYGIAFEYHLYFLTFRDIINWCIENNIHRYESGALSYDPKKRLDLKFSVNYIYVKHKNKIMNFFFGLLILLLKPENFDPLLKSIKRKIRDEKR